MAGYEPWSSGAGSDRSTYSATTTAPSSYIFCLSTHIAAAAQDTTIVIYTSRVCKVLINSRVPR